VTASAARLLVTLALALSARVAAVRCSGPPAPPQLVVFANGTAEITTADGARSSARLSEDQLVFLQALTASAMREPAGWLSYVPEELRELTLTLADGPAVRTMPAYVPRRGARADRSSESRVLNSVVDEASRAVGCPGLFDTCR
jgi:hypothetical protein